MKHSSTLVTVAIILAIIIMVVVLINLVDINV